MDERDYSVWVLSLLHTLKPMDQASRLRGEAAHSHNTQTQVTRDGRCLARFPHFGTMNVNGYPKRKPGTHHTTPCVLRSAS